MPAGRWALGGVWPRAELVAPTIELDAPTMALDPTIELAAPVGICWPPTMLRTEEAWELRLEDDWEVFLFG